MTRLVDDVERLEIALGDSTDPALGHGATLEADESEVFPHAAWAKLGAVGFARELVPVSVGGSFHDAERLFALGKCVARRDVTAAIATGQCMLGALPVWIAGTDAQRAFVADALGRGESGALALTERAHGSDLASCTTTASADATGYRLDGEKWAINNATRGRYLSVLARTDPAGGPRGFSLLLVDTRAPSVEATSTPLPKLRTHGIRAADISGRTFAGTSLASSACVGKPGHGLDLVQRTMHVSRTLCSAFSLGGAETALRAAHGFAQARVLYGAPVLAIPAARAVLRDAFVAFHVADLVAHATARALSFTPEQASISSAIAKTFVPEEAIAIVDAAASVLGARHYLREGPHAIVQKIVRDVRLIPLFDGSAAVNRSVLAAEWPRVASATDSATTTHGERLEAASRTRALVDVGGALGPVGFDRLRATSRGQCDPFLALPVFVAEAASLSPTLRGLAERIEGARAALVALGTSPEHRGLSNHEPRAHALADAFACMYVLALLLARALLVATDVSREDERPLLEAGMARLLRRLEASSPLAPAPASANDESTAEASARLDALFAQGCASRRGFGPLGPVIVENPSSWHAF